jgi:hypothetical protein
MMSCFILNVYSINILHISLPHPFPLSYPTFWFLQCVQVLQGTWASCWLTRLRLLIGHVESWLHVCRNGILLPYLHSIYQLVSLKWLIYVCSYLQISRKEPFFYGHDNHDQLVKIAKVISLWFAFAFNQLWCLHFLFNVFWYIILTLHC